jgi:hypothetical protein
MDQLQFTEASSNICREEGSREASTCIFDVNNNDVQDPSVNSESLFDLVEHENEFKLFPQLDQPGHISTNTFFEDFMNIDAFLPAEETNDEEFDTFQLLDVNDEATEASKLLSQDQIKMTDLIISLGLDNIQNEYQQDKFVVAEEADAASKLLTKEDNEVTDFILSYIENENDSALNSPQDVDDDVLDLLYSLTADTEIEKNVVDDLTSPSQSHVTEATNTKTVEFSEEVVSSSLSNEHNVNNSEVSEEVQNEFAQLLNSMKSPVTVNFVDQESRASDNTDFQIVNNDLSTIDLSCIFKSLDDDKKLNDERMNKSINSPVCDKQNSVESVNTLKRKK